jgi:uncharacterized damage-inducible protein DinB
LNQSLQKKFELLELQRKALFESLKKVSMEKLTQCPEGRWSIVQIVAHLIAAEKLSVAYLSKKIMAINEVGDTGLWEEIKMIGLILSQRLPLKYKAPRVVVENTAKETSIAQLEQEWASVRAELKALLENISDSQVNRKIYKHIFAGKLNVQQALVFLSEHFIHHQPQIRRLL